MVAPPFGDTGGPEVVVQNLTDALLEKEMEVTLFAPGDWHTNAKHISTLPQSLWNMKYFSRQTQTTRRNLIIASQIQVLNYQQKFDIVHLHSQRYAAGVGLALRTPCVLTFHNKINGINFKEIKNAGITTVAISRSQKGNIPTSATIWNGVPTKNITPSFEQGKYLIAIGRFVEQKGIDVAIAIAKKTGKKILIFGRIGNAPSKQEYFHKKIEPFIDGKQIIYKKEVSHDVIYKYLQGAEALLFTITSPDLFGMVVVEALACGTPIIGTNINPLPELLKNKKVAYVSNNIDSLVNAAQHTHHFDRRECRNYAEKNFDSLTMADQYIALYRKILEKHSHDQIKKS